MIDVSIVTSQAYGKVFGNGEIYGAIADAVSEDGRAYFEKHFGFAAVGVKLDNEKSLADMIEDMLASGLVVEMNGVIG